MTALTAPNLTTPATSVSLWASTTTLARRATLRFLRTPQEIIAGTATTAMFALIFLYVFGGEIDIPGLAYTDFLIPGYLTTAVLFTGMGTAAAVAEDLEQGVVDRLRSLPIPRVSFLAGRAIADVGVLVWSLAAATLVGVAVGFRVHGSAMEVLAAAGLVLAFGFAWIWVFILLGLVAGTAKGAQGFSFMVFPLTFVSSAYVRVETLPTWLQGFAEHQPLTVTIDAVRGLTLGEAGQALLEAPVATYVTRSVVWIIGLLLVAVPLSVLRYRRG